MACHKMAKAWDSFWFKTVDARQYAVLRIAFGSLSVIYLLALWPYIPVHFSGGGWLGNIRQISAQNGGSWSLFFIDFGNFANATAYAITGAGIISALFLTLGWHSRLSALITWLVWVSLWNRNPLLLDGDDAILKIMCFYLMLSPCGNAWSYDAYRVAKPKQSPVWPLRLIQGQIALIYFVSGWVKFHSAEWDNGAVLQIVLIHPHYSRWDGWFIFEYPIIRNVLALLAQLIRWWELLFPLLLFSRLTRNISLVFGLAFHLGLCLTLNLRWFPWVMLALYPALISTWTFAVYANKFEQFIAKRILNR
jgi:hypothetical protein